MSGRQARRVPADWVHPPGNKPGHKYLPLYDGRRLRGEGYHAGDPPEAFTPDWPDSERTHWQMYEQTSEGTPISPVMESPEALARWLVDNNASACGPLTATYEQWMATILTPVGCTISSVQINGKWTSGVAAQTMARASDRLTKTLTDEQVGRVARAVHEARRDSFDGFFAGSLSDVLVACCDNDLRSAIAIAEGWKLESWPWILRLLLDIQKELEP